MFALKFFNLRPALDGELHYAALAAPVSISRDARGVPTITAANRADLAFATGFVHAQDIQAIKGASHEHSFRLLYVDGAWSIFLCFFGGDIGAYVRLPGPNHEEWNSIDINAPIKSKDWTVSKSPLLPLMNNVHIEWLDSAKIIPCFKIQHSEAMMRPELVRKK